LVLGAGLEPNPFTYENEMPLLLCDRVFQEITGRQPAERVAIPHVALAQNQTIRAASN
jgi:hypothetical protein